MSIDYAKEREARKTEGFAKLTARLDKTADVLIAAMRKEGLVVKKLAQHRTTIEFDVKGATRVVLEAHYRSSYMSEAPTGREPLSLKVGRWGEQVITRSAKEDPDLTGVRVARIVENVKEDVAREARQEQESKRSAANLSASRRIVARLQKVLKGVEGDLRFEAGEKDEHRVRMLLDVVVTEEQARAVTSALVPLLVKINADGGGS